jgi:hypothetical protein
MYLSFIKVPYLISSALTDTAVSLLIRYTAMPSKPLPMTI